MPDRFGLEFVKIIDLVSESHPSLLDTKPETAKRDRKGSAKAAIMDRGEWSNSLMEGRGLTHPCKGWLNLD